MPSVGQVLVKQLVKIRNAETASVAAPNVGASVSVLNVAASIVPKGLAGLFSADSFGMGLAFA